VTSVMDWREMAGRQTLPRGKGLGDWLEGVAWSGGKVVGGSGAANSGGGGKSGYEEKRGLSEKEAGLGEGLVRLGGEGGGAVWVMRAEEVFSSQARDWEWDGIVDPRRGWIIAGAWSIACVVECVALSFLLSLLRSPCSLPIHLRLYTSLRLIPPWVLSIAVSQRRLPLPVRPPSDAHPRPHTHPDSVPSPSHHLLLTLPSDLLVLVGHRWREHAGDGHHGGTDLCEEGDDGGFGRGLDWELGGWKWRSRRGGKVVGRRWGG
jgi:hypothetical protein